MHYFNSQNIFDFPWASVMIGMWHKYPNAHCTHVLTVDVLDRSVDPETGIIRTERILGCKQKTPSWIVRLLGGSDDAYVREVSFIDPATQECTITSVNLTLSQFATCYERITYVPSPNDRQLKTVFTQSAEIQARLAVWRSLSDRMEQWMAERFAQNAQKGRLGFSDVLRSLWDGKENPVSLR